jgi:hypothetical protein
VTGQGYDHEERLAIQDFPQREQYNSGNLSISIPISINMLTILRKRLGIVQPASIESVISSSSSQTEFEFKHKNLLFIELSKL